MLCTSCSTNDELSPNNTPSKNKLKEIVTTYVEYDNSTKSSKISFSYNDNNQINSLNFSNHFINFTLNYKYNTKNQITIIETIDNRNNMSYLFELSYNDESMIPTKITQNSEPISASEILNIDNTLFWKTSSNKLSSISNVNIKDGTFSEYTNNNKTTKYKFHNNFKIGLEHNDTNFSIVTLIFTSYNLDDVELLTLYGLEYLDAPIDEMIVSNGNTLKFEYQMQNNKIASRIIKNITSANQTPITQTYTYY